MSGSRIMVSRSTLTRLAADELEHERSHLRARHDLVLEAFAVLHRATVRTGSSAPAGAPGSAGSSIAARVEVLRHTGRHPVQAGVVLLLAAALLAVPTLLVVVPWLAALRHASL